VVKPPARCGDQSYTLRSHQCLYQRWVIMSWQDDFLNRNRNLLVPVALIVLVTIFVQYIFRGLSSSRHRGLSLPPGPHRKWIIGNLLQMPKGDFVVQILKWAKDYGKPSKSNDSLSYHPDTRDSKRSNCLYSDSK